MKKILRITVFAAFLAAAVCCGSRGGRQRQAPPRPFPQTDIPSAYTSAQDRLSYAAAHYWDGYLAGTGATDSLLILGVPRAELEQALSNYIYLLWNLPLGEAQQNVAALFKGVCKAQQRDTASQFYTQFSQMAASYFYDPNSPLRDEDLWLPYVRGLAESPLSRDDMRTAWRYEASVCALCQRGSTAPDIKAERPDGSRFSLHGIKAPWTLLFFTNPGCKACKEIIDKINYEFGQMVASGRLAVANIYIDEDYKAWREYVSSYPPQWYTGFDYGRTVREGHEYDVRAIPSLYLLDSSKTIVLKDAPFERVVEILQNQ